MAQIALYEYLKQLDSLLDENRFSEVVAHCRHILQQCPRHIETYRTLGKAYLEQGAHGDAADILQRVLSAAPEDVVAHAGLSIIYKEQGRLPAAIWHMERAFEADPYNSIIRQVLKELYSGRDGAAPARILLTRAALAQLYLRGGLYQPAVAELRHALAEEAGRLDLKVLLAEALWRDDQRVEAVQVCQSILEHLPNCVSANAILAEVWLATGRRDEAHEYLQRLRALLQPQRSHADQDSPAGRALITDGLAALPAVALVEELDFVPGQVARGAEEPEWVRELGLSAEGSEDEDEVPLWLKEIGAADQTDPLAAMPAPTSMPGDDELDWLREAAMGEVERGRVELDDDDTRSAISSETEAKDLAQDWLQVSDLGEAAAARLQSDPSIGDAGWSEDVAGLSEAPSAGDNFDWLDEPAPAPESRLEMAEDDLRSSAGEEGRDWLIGTPEPDSLQPSDLPDWLLANPAGPPPGEVVRSEGATGPAAAPQDSATVDWLQDAATSGEVEWPVAAAAEQAAPDTDELADWLQQGRLAVDLPPADAEFPAWLAGVGDDGPGSAAESSDLADWLAEVGSGDEAEDVLPIRSIAPAEADLAAGPDWLSGDEPAEVDIMSGIDEPDKEPGEAPEDFDEAMAWLDKLAAGQGAPLEELPSMEEGDLASGLADEDVPDWLKMDLEGEAAASAVADWTEPDSRTDAVSADLPDWLAAEPGIDESATLLALQGAALPAAEIPDWLREQMPDRLPETPASDELTWLDEIATGQGSAVEETPTMSWQEREAQPNEEVSLADITASLAEGDDSLDWLSEMEVVDQGMPAEAAGAIDPSVFDDFPEDPEAALAWLEQLASEPEMAVEAPPDARAEPVEAGHPTADSEDFDFFSDLKTEDFEIAAAMSAPPDEEAEAMAWLEELAGAPGTPVADLAAEAETPVGEEMPAGGVTDETFALDFAAADAGALDLEMAGGEELFVAVPDDPDEAMAWLERLAAGQGAPLEELPSLEMVDKTEDASRVMATSIGAEEDAPADADALLEAFAQIPDDPDAAIAWLEQLAAEQRAPLKEEPGLELAAEEADDTALTLEISAADVLTELPDDADETMARLVELVLEEDEAAEEPAVILETEDEAVQPADDEAILADIERAEPLVLDAGDFTGEELVAEPATPEVDDLVLEMETADFAEVIPDDPDAALAWLEQLGSAEVTADEDFAPEAPFEIVEEPVTPVVALDLLEMRAEVEALLPPEVEQPPPPEMAALDEMPDDPESAMAWLEALAARQGAPLEELRTVGAVEGEVEMPDWVAREMAEAPADAFVVAEQASPEPSAELDFLSNLEPADGAAEAAATGTAAEEEDDLMGLGEAFEAQAIGDSLPDWLSFEPSGGLQEEEIGWIDSLVEADVTGWLEAEEQTSQVDMPVPDWQPDAALSEPPAAPSRPLEPVAATPPVMPAGLDQAELVAARAAIADDAHLAAVSHYSALLNSGAGLSVLIADLEAAVTSHGQHALVVRVLGDAYMRNGQLQKALDTYRRALDQL